MPSLKYRSAQLQPLRATKFMKTTHDALSLHDINRYAPLGFGSHKLDGVRRIMYDKQLC